MKLYRLLFIVFVFLIVEGIGFSQSPFATETVDLGTVTPGGRELTVIAIPDFNPAKSSSLLKEGVLSEIVYRDLELSGYFLKPKNLQIVKENNLRDKKAGKVDFMEWRRLGASFLLLGDYFINESSLWTEVHLFDVGTGKKIFGKKFENFKPNQFRILGHKISDEIIHYITGINGVANTKIAFVSNRAGHKEVWIMDADGYNQHSITNDKSITAVPCWGKNATEIYYTSYKEYNPDLCGVFLDGSKSWFITKFSGLNFAPSWSEKTQRLAVTLGKDGNSEIYTMDRNGKSSKRLTYNKSIDSSPCWSPEGNEIVFTSDRSGEPQLFIMNSEGFNVRRVTLQGRYNDAGVWSPKGDKIAFQGRSSGFFNIFLMNVDGTDWVQLTYNQGNNEDPSWSPDGQHLVFSSDRNGKPQIFVMHIDGSGQTQLTFKEISHSSAWSPYLD